VSLPSLLLRLLPGGAIQFPGGIFTRCGSTPFHGALSFMDYDLGYFDLETRVLEPLENPFDPKVLPMS